MAAETAHRPEKVVTTFRKAVTTILKAVTTFLKVVTTFLQWSLRCLTKQAPLAGKEGSVGG